MMRIFFLTSVVMVAFAANSILNRAGVDAGAISAEMFALVRVLSGATMLIVLLLMRQGAVFQRPNPWAVVGLAIYLIGFSQAYIQLDAGLGALLLFGGVQVTMFAGAVLSREQIPTTRWLGMAISFGGLVWLIGGLDSAGFVQLAVLFMLAAAIGWGVYSLVGRGAHDPLRATAWNFVGASGLVLLASFATGGETSPITAFGWVTAIASGAITSALGYALWYAVLPQISASRAAVAQLSVPVIAFLGGVLFLGEAITLRDVLAGAIVLGGIALSVWPQAR
jgi:drug/metabolite transporter (DMT)-like permease